MPAALVELAQAVDVEQHERRAGLLALRARQLAASDVEQMVPVEEPGGRVDARAALGLLAGELQPDACALALGDVADHGVVGDRVRIGVRTGARPDPALDPVEAAQAVSGVGRLAPCELRQVGVQQRTVVRMDAVVPDGWPIGAFGQWATEHALDAGARVDPHGAVLVVKLARDDELGDPAEHALEPQGQVVALVRGLVQRRDVGDHAVEVDDPVVAQAVREDPLPDPALHAVVAAQAVLELERVQQALVLVREHFLVARAVVRVNRGQPLLVGAEGVGDEPEQ